MKQFRKYLLLLLLCLPLSTYGQLNEFMVETYFFGVLPLEDRENPENFFGNLKETYNFNTVLFWSLDIGPDYDTLYKAAKNVGLKSILYRNALASRLGDINKQLALEEISKYSGSEYNVIGYQIVDEPDAKTTSYPYGSSGNDTTSISQYIDNIPQYTAFIRDYGGSSLLKYANLLPQQAFENSDQEYREEYIQRYLTTSKPNFLSFDHYPIFDADRKYNFFLSLYDHALKSVENSIPFIYVLTPYTKYAHHMDGNNPPDYFYPAKDINAFYYVIYAALTYGAKGISYFSGFEWVRNAGLCDIMLKYDPEVKQQLSILHKKLIDHSDELLSLNFASAYHKSNKSTIDSTGINLEKIHSFSLWNYFANDKLAQEVFQNFPDPIKEVSTGNVPEELAVTFHTNKSEEVYFWLFNKSLDRELNLKLSLVYSAEDILNGGVVNNQGTVHLAPGEAKLFKSALPAHMLDLNIYNRIYQNRFYPLETAETFTIGSVALTPNVIFSPGATKSFHGNEIKISSLHAKPGSIVRFKSYTDTNKSSASGMIRSKEYPGTTEVTKEILKDRDTYVYPNPIVDDQIKLFMNLDENEEVQVEIYDTMGKALKTLKTSTKETSIPMGDVRSGIYLIHFNRNNQVHNIKVIKR